MVISPKKIIKTLLYVLVTWLFSNYTAHGQTTIEYRIGLHSPVLQIAKTKPVSTSSAFSREQTKTISNSNGFYLGWQIAKPFLGSLQYRTGLNLQYNNHKISSQNSFTNRFDATMLIAESQEERIYQFLHLNLPFSIEKVLTLSSFNFTFGSGFYYNLAAYSKEKITESSTDYFNYQTTYDAICDCRRITETSTIINPQTNTFSRSIRGEYGYQPFGWLFSTMIHKPLKNGQQLGISYQFNRDFNFSVETSTNTYKQISHQIGLSYQFQKKSNPSIKSPSISSPKGTFLIGTSWHLYYPSDAYFVSGPTLTLNYLSKSRWGFEVMGSFLDEEYDLYHFSGRAIDANILYGFFSNKFYGKIGTTIAFRGDAEYNNLDGKALQIGLGLFQPFNKKWILKIDLHQRLWVASSYIPRKFTLGLNLGVSYQL